MTNMEKETDRNNKHVYVLPNTIATRMPNLHQNCKNTQRVIGSVFVGAVSVKALNRKSVWHVGSPRLGVAEVFPQIRRHIPFKSTSSELISVPQSSHIEPWREPNRDARIARLHASIDQFKVIS